jgi:hypothetical protein
VNSQQIVEWLRRLAYLDTRVFEDVRSNPSATLAGLFFVAAASFLSGIGGFLWWMMRDYGGNGDIFLHSAVIGSLIAVVLWGLAWLGIVYVILTQIFRERAYLEQLLRVMGLAATPLALSIFMFIPWVSFAIGIASLALAFGLTSIAIQSVTTAGPARVLVANLCGFAVWAAVLTLLSTATVSDVKPHAPGVFLFNTTASISSDFLELARRELLP